MKKNYLLVFFQLLFVCAFAQNDTILSKKLKEVEISSNSNTYNSETAMNLSSISSTKMSENGSYNISDALTAMPGLSQMNTGPAISKPVLRGLYGNRLQTVFSGLRFDNQQWQDEHGLGISDVGVDRVEVIKGPASLLYGSEAVGGVINIIEERPAEDGTIVGDLNTKYFSNTLGSSTNIGFKGNNNGKNWRIRAGYESNADYSDGANQRILNSRFDGYYLKASFGLTKARWISQNNYNASLNDFGFIMADNYNSKTFDTRNSRTMDGPHHTVLLNILSSQNIIRLKRSLLKVNVGAQSNIRMEDEGGAEISLNMHLNSLIYNAQWIKSISARTEIVLSNQGLLQSNTNFGKRIIVPDATMSELGLSLFFNHKLNKLIFEIGVGANYRSIKTVETQNLNTPDKEIGPFSRQLPSLNEMIGLTYNPSSHLNFKLCGSSGFRSGNLAELASNGLHEGIYQYEIGNKNLQAEQNYNVEAGFNYASEQLTFSLNVFNNYFNNYIYLAPTQESFYGIQVFRYFQSNADLYGGEVSLTLKPRLLNGLSLTTFYSSVTGVLNDSSSLPFIPANKIHSELRYTFPKYKKIDLLYLMLGNDYVFAQTHPAVYETSTDAYSLFNAGLGINLKIKKQELHLNVVCNNLLNENYYDHLSRFKKYGFHNIGRNVVFTLKIPIELINKNK